MQYRPEWLKPSRIPVTIVCGPPASGKSTYVRERAGPNDLILDLDVIASEMAGHSIDLGSASLHSWDRQRLLVPAMRRRNSLLGELHRTTRWPRAWLIITEARADRRQWWSDRLKPERIVVLEVPPDICRARARQDVGRSLQRTDAAIASWWASYQRRNGDYIQRVSDDILGVGGGQISDPQHLWTAVPQRKNPRAN